MRTEGRTRKSPLCALEILFSLWSLCFKVWRSSVTYARVLRGRGCVLLHRAGTVGKIRLQQLLEHLGLDRLSHERTNARTIQFLCTEALTVTGVQDHRNVGETRAELGCEFQAGQLGHRL